MRPVLRRWLDPQTRDYVVEAGAPRGDDTAASEVVLRVTTPLGSFVPDPTFGSRLFQIDRIARGTERRARAFVVEALRPMTKRGVLPELEVEVVRDSVSGLAISIGFKNTSGDPNTVRIAHRVGG